MHPRRSICALLLAVVLASAGAPGAATTLYRWVDEHGVTHYSDRPAPGAERLKVGSAQSYHATTDVARSAEPAAGPDVSYTRVAIVEPQDGAVVINQGGRVEVSAAVEPALVTGHQIWFILDGLRLEGLSPTGTSAALELPRGAHSVSVSVTDAGGRELVASAAVSFSVRQTSIATPPRGPALPPPPKRP